MYAYLMEFLVFSGFMFWHIPMTEKPSSSDKLKHLKCLSDLMSHAEVPELLAVEYFAISSLHLREYLITPTLLNKRCSVPRSHSLR